MSKEQSGIEIQNNGNNEVEGVGVGLSEDVECIEPRLQRRGFQLVQVYPVKFLCGEQTKIEGPVKPANYATAINIINIFDLNVTFTKKAVLARSQHEEPGPISKKVKETLRPNQALEINCMDIRNLLDIPTGFIKGFVVIEVPITPGILPITPGITPGFADRVLEVVAVYTALHKQFAFE